MLNRLYTYNSFAGYLKGRGYSFVLHAVIALIFFSACRKEEPQKIEPQSSPDTLRLAYVNWAEGVTMSRLGAELIQHHYPYKVNLEPFDVSTVYNRLATGRSDFFMDAWLPQTHRPYWNDYDSLLTDLGVNVPHVRTGLVVPSYVSIEEIGQLPAINEKINGNIIGIEHSAGIMATTEQMLSAYGLNMELLVTSDPEMVQALQDAIAQRDPIVVTGWQPHWKFIAFNLKFLRDPKNVYPTDEAIHTIARKDFADDHPDVAAFLKNFQLSADRLDSLMFQMHAKPDSAELVMNRWIQSHQAMVQEWVNTDSTAHKVAEH
ncbi:MAG TPA: glycine betaine ABC transporter substrate-binding protein [Balneolaceae bacterium]|nr:glycine betaine ABC transporter substrate-binding protein [Balneolaceae bacterium]